LTEQLVGDRLLIPLTGGHVEATKPSLMKYGTQPKDMVQVTVSYAGDSVQVILPASAFRTIADKFGSE